MTRHKLAFIFIVAVIAVFVLVLMVAQLAEAEGFAIHFPIILNGEAIPTPGTRPTPTLSPTMCVPVCP